MVCLVALASLSAAASPGSAQEPEPARIRGVVTSSDGVHLTDVTVRVYYVSGPDDYRYAGMGFTESDGSYECTIDDHYPPFVLLAEDGTRRHAPQLVGSPSIFTPEEATRFVLSPGETLDGVDVVLEEGGAIEGHVRSRDDGRPLGGSMLVAAQAWVETLDGGEWREPPDIAWGLCGGRADEYTGAYTIRGLESRMYRVQFQDSWGTIIPEDMNDAHQWIYFGNEADPARAAPVSVDGTHTTSDVDIDPVQAKARIFGTDRYQTALA
ncbi:MAG: hypothetical protein U1E29_16405, partial [Coriobacteriia bacterium]|nr:hypothetical protein [Coriobacteriia bacterium]